ncbi:HNH endonuclease [Streptomyces genisteinicus]|uniref:HNH endonuclease n=1 Tax=Streptomyces genisteinicus TaxID=2768068 RepID=A0A7H0HSI7_9ACTN|nr:HNH endonuclease [Streptomyces genisteinicus]
MGASRYPKEVLDTTARESRSMSEMMTRLGLDPGGATRKYLRARMIRLGVDTSHFEREGVRWTREVLTPVVAASTSMCEVLRRLGLDIVGGHHTHISRRVRALGLDTSHFGTPDRAGGTRRRSPSAALVVQPPDRSRRVPGERLRRAMTGEGVPDRCALCGTAPSWRDRPLTLEVDHVDGDWRNNRIENLRLLCPNCHAVTDTYRGRAKRPAPPGAAERLRAAVADSVTVAGALRLLDRPVSPRQRALFRDLVAEHGIDTSHFHRQVHRHRQPVATPLSGEEILVRHDRGRRTRTAVLRRALAATGVPELCAGCGTGPGWHGRRLVLEIDHVNGDRHDDRRENLRLLCPNCHAVTGTWCRGGSRKPVAAPRGAAVD